MRISPPENSFQVEIFAFVLQIYRFECSAPSVSAEAATTQSSSEVVVGGQEAGRDVRGEREEGWGVANGEAQ